jgi:hypothetical protein
MERSKGSIVALVGAKGKREVFLIQATGGFSAFPNSASFFLSDEL